MVRIVFEMSKAEEFAIAATDVQGKTLVVLVERPVLYRLLSRDLKTGKETEVSRHEKFKKAMRAFDALVAVSGGK